MSRQRDKVRHQLEIKKRLEIREEADNLKASGRSKEAEALLFAHGLIDAPRPDPKVEQAKGFLREGKGQELLDFMRDGHLTGAQVYELTKSLVEPVDDPAAESDRQQLLAAYNAMIDARAADIPFGEMSAKNTDIDWPKAEQIKVEGD